jgi:hypothetical protein
VISSDKAEPGSEEQQDESVAGGSS